MKPRKGQIWGSHLEESPDELMVSFCAGRDVAPLPMADEALLPFDLWTNRAHAIMLARSRIITRDMLAAILQALHELEDLWARGKWKLDPRLEDVHMNVERFVASRAGEDAGGRLHTGRSRNDQVSCDMRLFIRQALLELGQTVRDLALEIVKLAPRHATTLMPGFTHHQPAMITTWGHWLCSYAQALCRDLERTALACRMVNRSPLGAAASFGTSWPINRELTAELLGFDSVDANTQDCISSRWEHEAQAAGVYSMLMNHLSTMSQDLILLSHPYWGFVSLPDKFVTGSSIMPQKKNPDLAEVIKGKTAWLNGMTAGLLAMPRGNMSGYNRDTQWTKYSLLDVVRECAPAPRLMREVLKGLAVHKSVMRQRLGQGFPEAADFADALSRALNLPFRSCYDIAAHAVRLSGEYGNIQADAAARALEQAGHDPAGAAGVLQDLADPERILSWRNHTGSPHPERVREQAARLKEQISREAEFIGQIGRQADRALRKCGQQG
ncbi:MAG: argininosuccinate lyase [Deltaproteobacteria bacterium]|nr:argininosuccinate lyase [Deltaproteobacteria bacterium]